MNPLISTIVVGLVEGVKGFFGLKQSKLDSVSKLIDAASMIDTNDTETKKAAAAAIVAEMNSGYWLAAVWRPMLMLFFAVLVGARWFGYTPPNMNEAELLEVYGLLKMGVGGYMGGRTVEKVISSINLTKLLSKLY